MTAPMKCLTRAHWEKPQKVRKLSVGPDAKDKFRQLEHSQRKHTCDLPYVQKLSKASCGSKSNSIFYLLTVLYLGRKQPKNVLAFVSQDTGFPCQLRKCWQMQFQKCMRQQGKKRKSSISEPQFSHLQMSLQSRPAATWPRSSLYPLLHKTLLLSLAHEAT